MTWPYAKHLKKSFIYYPSVIFLNTMTHNIVIVCLSKVVWLFIAIFGLIAISCFMFCCTLLYVHSSFAIILGKRELIALLSLSSWCFVMVV